MERNHACHLWQNDTNILQNKALQINDKTSLSIWSRNVATAINRRGKAGKNRDVDVKMGNGIKSYKDNFRSNYIRAELCVDVISDKVTEPRLRWYGHVERSNEFINIAKNMN
jgi:hypothetical protein